MWSHQRTLCRWWMVGIATLLSWAVHAEDSLLDARQLAALVSQYGEIARVRVEEWERFMRQHRARPEAEKVEAVNRYINRIAAGSAGRQAGSESWPTPWEWIAGRQNGSEGLAVAKYYTLAAMGVPRARLRLMKFVKKDPRHSCLVPGYYPPQEEAGPLLLRYDTDVLTPLASWHSGALQYSFNSAWLWVGNNPQPLASADRVDLWRDVRERTEYVLFGDD